MRSRGIRGGVCVGLVAAMGLVAGCSVNPATGKRQLALISESQEIAMGRDYDEQIVGSLGLYGGDELQGYVQRLGADLAARSERPHLPWTFRVVDDPAVNAFALPGGFIYVTRGIMAHLNSEAELVGVLGHEIGHVTARHSVNQLSKQQLLGLGLGIGMVASEEFRRFGDLAQQGLGLLFLRFSRDDERQADHLGIRYSLRSGYDPGRMAELFTVLERVGEEAGGGRVPNWLATHPDPGERRERVRSAVAALEVDISGAKVEQASYLRRLEGMVFGADPREGFFEGQRFLHPELAFRLDFPSGWETQNQKQAVVGVSEGRDALLQITLVSQESPTAAAREFAGREGLRAGRVETGSLGGFPAAAVEFQADTDQGTLQGRSAYVRYNDRTFQLLGLTTEQGWARHGRGIVIAQKSFDRLNDENALNVQPARLQIVDLDGPLSLPEFERRYPSTVETGTLALINHIPADGTLPRGFGAKRVIGGVGE